MRPKLLSMARTVRGAADVWREPHRRKSELFEGERTICGGDVSAKRDGTDGSRRLYYKLYSAER